MDSNAFIGQLLVSLGTILTVVSAVYTTWYQCIGKKQVALRQAEQEQREKEHKELQESLALLRSAIEDLKETMIHTVSDVSHLTEDIAVLKRRVDVHGTEIDDNHDRIIAIESKMQYCPTHQKAS